MGATGAMKVGGGIWTCLAGKDEMEEEEGGGEEDERAQEVGGDEVTGRTGVRKETGDAGSETLGGTAPPAAAAEGFVLVAAAAARGEVGRAVAKT